jgi:peptidoglycan/LPS O-acetylase OafA/YrhL
VIDTPEKMPQFWLSLQERWFRIAPAYIFILIISVIVTGYIHGINAIDIPSFLAGITFTTWMSPDTLFPAILNGPLWFVSFDMIGWILTSLCMMGLFSI